MCVDVAGDDVGDTHSHVLDQSAGSPPRRALYVSHLRPTQYLMRVAGSLRTKLIASTVAVPAAIFDPIARSVIGRLTVASEARQELTLAS